MESALPFVHGQTALCSPEHRYEKKGYEPMRKPANELAPGSAQTEAQPNVNADERVFCKADRPTLHHVSLFVSDMEASARFYTAGLGLTLKETFQDIIGLRASGEFPFEVESIFLEAGDGRYIELHPAAQGAMSPPGFPLNHLALGVVDVDAAYTRALAAGATPVDIPVPGDEWDGAPLDVVLSGDRPEPMRMAFLLGPSDELIELYQAAAT